jgi:hypothetical protein
MARLVFLVPLPFVRRWRKRIVANVDFNGVRGAQVLPVLGREVIEGEQHRAIFSQALTGSFVFGLVLGEERVECLVRRLARFGHPDLLKVGLGPGAARSWASC